LRKGTAPGGYHAFSAPEIADPSGRGIWFHGDCFQDEKEPGTPEYEGPASRSQSRAPSPRRTAISRVFIRLQPSRFRRGCANTLFLGFE
jgi:hypothetical protein